MRAFAGSIALLAALLAALLGGLPGAIEVVEADGAITIRDGAQVVLVYHTATVPPPEGADPRFARSAFIHPLKAPGGGTLTAIHPADHIHHVGIWNAWVKTTHGDRKPDFWNLKSGTGLVRFSETLEIRPRSGFSVRQEQVSLADGAAPLTVLSEVLAVDVRTDAGRYVIDYTLTQTNVSDLPLELPAYRYGGPLAYRGPEHWDKENSRVLTSEGRTRADGHATRGRWCAFEGPVTDVGGKATLAILCHPSNHDAPQRMRIWPPSSHDGAPFFNYVPIQEHAWSIGAGAAVTHRYQLLASEGEIAPEAIDAAWEAFAKSVPSE